MASPQIPLLTLFSIAFLYIFSLSSVVAQDPAHIVTDKFFNGITASNAGSGCAGNSFYTRAAFLQAARADAFKGFGTTGAPDVRKREMAAFFANVAHVTFDLCDIREDNRGVYCDTKKYPCAPGKSYYGRGPLQLKWNYNYIPAGRVIGFDGLNNPGILETDAVISFKTAVWFWMKFIHSDFVSSGSFASTIRAINKIECRDSVYWSPAAVEDRVQHYQNYCRQLGVDPGSDLYC